MGHNNDDIVKLAVLYCLHDILLGVDNQKFIGLDVIQLADNLSRFNECPYGFLVWDMTVESMSKVIRSCYTKVLHHYEKKLKVTLRFPISFSGTNLSCPLLIKNFINLFFLLLIEYS